MSAHTPSVTGTDIWYYFICKRELWLMMHKIAPDQEDENVDVGRFLHKYYSQRGKEEVDIGSGKVDRLKKSGNKLIVQEIKKSSRFKESSYYQLLFYLYQFKQMGIEVTGELLFMEERMKETVELTDNNQKKLDEVIKDIQILARKPTPPPPKRIKFCNKCAYREYCWVGES